MSEGLRPLHDFLREFQKDLLRGWSGARTPSRLSTGFSDLVKLLVGGLARESLIVLAGRESMGKTALALSIARHAAVQSKAVVAYFGHAQPGMEIAARLIAAESGIQSSRLLAEDLTALESFKLGSALGVLVDTHLYLHGDATISVNELRSKTRSLHSEIPLDLIVIDDLFGVVASRQQDSRESHASEACRHLKTLARELGAAAIALCRVPDTVARRTIRLPQLLDLPGFGPAENHADVVAFLHREDFYDQSTEKQGGAEIHVMKNRDGYTGAVSILFESRTNRFLDLEVYRD